MNSLALFLLVHNEIIIDMLHTLEFADWAHALEGLKHCKNRSITGRRWWLQKGKRKFWLWKEGHRLCSRTNKIYPSILQRELCIILTWLIMQSFFGELVSASKRRSKLWIITQVLPVFQGIHQTQNWWRSLSAVCWNSASFGRASWRFWKSSNATAGIEACRHDASCYPEAQFVTVSGLVSLLWDRNNCESLSAGTKSSKDYRMRSR